ncbi:MAG: DUF3040 domain-containing protein [Actinomycetes bacterium]|nr:MAG: DUF3040 domain-containing protein [Actinomycetota bacterium]
MPLSEYEQRVLEQLERDLGADPKLGRTMARQPRSRGRLVVAVFGIIAGIAVLLVGAVTQIVLLGVAGFAIMALAALWAMLSPVKEAPAPARSAKGKGRARDGRPFMVRLEERFERRRQQGDL